MNIKHIFLIAAVAAMAACTSETATDVIFSTEKFKLTETSISLTKEAATRTLVVESNCDWDFTVKKTDEWPNLTIQKSADGLTIQTEANNTRSTHHATITLTTKGGISRTVDVSQAQGDVLLETQGGTNKTLTFLYSGGKQEFTVTSNTTWTITGKADWFTLSKDSGTGSDKVEVTASEIQTDVARDATLVVSGENGAKTDYIIIQQQGKEVILSVSPTKLNYTATGGTKELMITCNAEWTATANDDWVMLSEHSGSQNKTITVTLKENKTTEPLTSSVTFSAGSKTSETVDITQAAAELPAVTSISIVEGSVNKHEATIVFSCRSQFPFSAAGLCISTTNQQPTTGDTVIEATLKDITTDDSGYYVAEGVTVNLDGLQSLTTYHVRAYVNNEIGTAYSQKVSFTTQGGLPSEDDNQMPNPQ